MSDYFSDREGRARPRTGDTINWKTWRGILSLIQARITDSSLGFGFPLQCEDGGAICGTDEGSFWDRAVAEIPRLVSDSETPDDDYSAPWRPRPHELPPTDAILDLCELVAINVGNPVLMGYHDYLRHDHFRYDREEGLSAWVHAVDRLFARSGLVYEMDMDGNVKRRLPVPLAEITSATDFSTGDAMADALLNRAVNLLTSREPDAHQDAIEKLWDAFERIKTLEDEDKRLGADALLFAARATNAPMFNEIIRLEFRALTDLGNKHQIRHSEIGKERIPSRREAEYLFHRLFALLRYVLLQTARIRQT